MWMALQQWVSALQVHGIVQLMVTKINESHITFLNVQTMLETLSPRRLDLLKFVRQHGAESVKSLALALQRDYKNVHHDVSVLESTGLLIRDGRKLSAPWDELIASVSLTTA